VGRRHEPGVHELREKQDLSRRVFRYRGYRVQKAQAGWSVFLGNREVGWGSTKVRAKQFVDAMLACGRV
jgi:hypothetical protein